MTRQEGLRFAKDRALALLPNCTEAVTSFMSDVGGIESLEDVNRTAMVLWPMTLGMMATNDISGVRTWIEGFN